MFFQIENKLVLLAMSPHMILHTKRHGWSLIFGNAQTETAFMFEKFVFPNRSTVVPLIILRWGILS